MVVGWDRLREAEAQGPDSKGTVARRPDTGASEVAYGGRTYGIPRNFFKGPFATPVTVAWSS
jgi:hypothetical protein